MKLTLLKITVWQGLSPLVEVYWRSWLSMFKLWMVASLLVCIDLLCVAFNTSVFELNNANWQPRSAGQIRPATSFYVTRKNIISLLYGYMPLYRSTLPINYMSHNASHFVTCALKRLAIIHRRLLLSDVINYEVMTLSDNNPMLCLDPLLSEFGSRLSYDFVNSFQTL